MDNFLNNLNLMLEYYFFSGKIFERLILPCIILVVGFLAVRYFLSWCFQISTRVKNIKNINTKVIDLEKELKVQTKLTEEYLQKITKMSESIELIYSELKRENDIKRQVLGQGANKEPEHEESKESQQEE